ncbi:hypothetical protein AMTR_s00039p00210980 [Amborella trichopoda]|uniref:Uncharacterized protein n=1 Tax=Amborella trichopoda TaxID=13333 RepID=U5D0D7_AMBTC|nr:hypothetical protein AMTR_s00039p00210980 [Amborella trichopoda]
MNDLHLISPTLCALSQGYVAAIDRWNPWSSPMIGPSLDLYFVKALPLLPLFLTHGFIDPPHDQNIFPPFRLLQQAHLHLWSHHARHSIPDPLKDVLFWFVEISLLFFTHCSSFVNLPPFSVTTITSFPPIIPHPSPVLRLPLSPFPFSCLGLIPPLLAALP